MKRTTDYTDCTDFKRYIRWIIMDYTDASRYTTIRNQSV